MKHEFELQHYYLKWLCALPFLLAALGLQYLFSRFTDNEMVFYAVCALSMGGVFCLYYLITADMGFFRYKGYYREEEDAVFIEDGKKTYRVREVNALIGMEPDIFLYRYAHLVIETPEGKIKLFGQSLHGEMAFSDSELYPLYRLLLKKNPDLKVKKIFGAGIENWYCRK